MENKFRLCFKLLDRFTDPEMCIPLFLLRIRGNTDSTTAFLEGSSHSKKSRATHVFVFQYMLLGSLSNLLY